ncbi:hypothetical protein CA3LBN_003441 [Candidozyma haemuli]|uniref:ACB domain-containing protein n=1 Tax=Candidozyma haemuli TaxID=45357 RepID=A0ABX8IB73_9ASCO|nr:hypothetical protein CA3LBN_003441 [[Candida] haemuloni]
MNMKKRKGALAHRLKRRWSSECVDDSAEKSESIKVITEPNRVFVKAITTIRALSSRSNYGTLPRPPAENRVKLYGLYKQATEGNVVGIMARPQGHTLEDEGAKKKWDAWKREEGLSRTEAKRQYISYLIETMRVYASGTSEARELLGELEYLWDQIKDVEFSDDEEPARRFQSPFQQQQQQYDPVNRFVSKSPDLSQVDQSDRLSSGTPWPIGSTYSASVSNQQYRSNLEQIYSHSTRNTQLSLSEYVQQQRNKGAQSVYSMSGRRGIANAGSVGSTGRQEGKVPEAALEDFRNWQGEINTIVNKLSKEFLGRKSSGRSASSSSESEPESDLDPKERIKRRVVHVLRLVGIQALHFLKNFSISVVALLFLVWCIKRNVVVESTLVKQQLDSTRRKKELVVNMIVNTDENKWFVRLLSFINSFVGFV